MRSWLTLSRSSCICVAKKDPDELAMMAWANEANRVLYEHARRIIEPGMNELEVCNELQGFAVWELREPST